MDLILCHQTADFDALGAAVGLSKLIAGARIVLTGGSHPAVKDFLALHRDELSLIERRSVNPKNIRSLIVADTQHRDRLGKAAEWFDLPNLSSILLYDHHIDSDCDIPATGINIEAVGATSTMIVELLQRENIKLNSVEATVMALGIHVDTGSLTYDQSTSRDAYALAWLMEQGANIRTISEYVEPSLSLELQKLLTIALENLEQTKVQGYTIASVLLETERFVPGLSNLAARVIDLTESEVLLLGHHYRRGQREDKDGELGDSRLTVIGRSRFEGINLNQLFEPFGGGGHSSAASLSLRGVDPQTILKSLLNSIISAIPRPLTARDLMSSPVRTIRPSTTIEQAQRILLRYGHSGLSVVDENDLLVGIISRRDLDLALHHGFSHAPVKGYMTRNIKTIFPDTLLPEIESLMVTYDVGRLPVLQDDKLMGIVTRTDVLRQIHQDRQQSKDEQDKKSVLVSCLLPSIRDRLHPPIWNLLAKASAKAQEKGWHLYLVGGAVRDLLLVSNNEFLLLQDIDLVVDGFHEACDDRAGVELATLLQQIYPESRLSIHGEFQTAALLWHKDTELGSLWVDIATARTEFYPYPAANPEVEASSIRQDLYRRDFTINALAIRLTSPREGELLDFFGGTLDLRSRLIRVLHANSFIEDPTRIYRAVRFAVRLGFALESQTEEYIRYAIESGVYYRVSTENNVTPALTTRLKAELKYIFDAPYWKRSLQLLASLEALRCLHPSLQLDRYLWWQIRCIDRWSKILDSPIENPHWLIILETIIAYLLPEYRLKVAQKFYLPKESIKRIKELHNTVKIIKESLPKCKLPSEIVMLLRQYNQMELMLVGVKSDRSLRRIIWHYLAHLSKVKPLLNGDDLKALGYKPSPIYARILDELLRATLDGKISDRNQAKEFLSRFVVAL